MGEKRDISSLDTTLHFQHVRQKREPRVNREFRRQHFSRDDHTQKKRERTKAVADITKAIDIYTILYIHTRTYNVTVHFLYD